MLALRIWIIFASLFGLFLSSGCGRKKAPATAAMRRVKLGYQENGIASWYGRPYHGRATASGEIYDMERLTAAHPRLPFGVTTRVVNLGNGKSVEVRINDRGPFVRGRIIDLSRAAAQQIDLLGPGVTRVHLKVVAAPASVRAGIAHNPTSRFSFLLHPRRTRQQRREGEFIATMSTGAIEERPAVERSNASPQAPEPAPTQE